MNSNDQLSTLTSGCGKLERSIQKLAEKSSFGNKNDRETRGEHKRVNQSILKNTMQEWTTVVEDSTVVNNTEISKIDVSKPGVTKNAWQIHKEYLLKDDSMAGEMMRILSAGDENSKPNPEDEYKASIARLQQERSIRMHHEQMMSKGRMNKKIKSKGFHRHAKRRDLKEYLKKEENNGNNEDSLKEKLSQFEKIRAQERMSLRHKFGGKFAKIQKLRAKYDANAREALDGMREKGKELTKKMNDESEEESEDDEEDEEKESEMSDEVEEEEEENEESGEEERERGDEEMVAPALGKSSAMENSSKHRAKSFVEKIGEGSEEICEMAERKRGKLSSTLSTIESNFLSCDAMELEEGGGELASTDEARFKEAIYDLYEHDCDLAAEFAREKSELVEQENPKDVELFKPGWGAWTGAGFEEADRRRRQRGLIRAPDANRRDKRRTRVWIKQGVHDGLKKHLIKAIPFPYNTAEQFDLSRKELISSTFTLQTVHRELVKPKFVNKAGQHIYPRSKFENNNKKIN